MIGGGEKGARVPGAEGINVNTSICLSMVLYRKGGERRAGLIEGTVDAERNREGELMGTSILGVGGT